MKPKKIITLTLTHYLSSNQNRAEIVMSATGARTIVRNFINWRLKNSLWCDAKFVTIGKDYPDARITAKKKNIWRCIDWCVVIAALQLITIIFYGGVERGQACLCRKTVGFKFAEGRSLVDLAREKGKNSSSVNSSLSFGGSSDEEMINRGEIGRLQYIYSADFLWQNPEEETFFVFRSFMIIFSYSCV